LRKIKDSTFKAFILANYILCNFYQDVCVPLGKQILTTKRRNTGSSVSSHQLPLALTAFAMMKNVIGYIDNTGFLVLILHSLLVQSSALKPSIK